jgi:hypothetical protein
MRTLTTLLKLLFLPGRYESVILQLDDGITAIFVGTKNAMTDFYKIVEKHRIKHLIDETQ